MTRFTLARLLTAGFVLTILIPGCGSDDPTGREVFTAQLSGSSMVPPITTASLGAAYIDIDRETTQATGPHVHVKIEVRNVIGVTTGSLQLGPAGQAATPWIEVFNVQPPVDANGPAAKIGFTYAFPAERTAVINGVSYDEFVQRLRDGTLAVTVMTTGHPQGEMRGQFQ